jgi:1-acyl-sn-glycerol-3-phosphate acyltransferase
VLNRLAKLIIYLAGWKIAGNPVAAKKCVIVVAFHTSNWDALPCLGFNLALDKGVFWVGKHSLFFWPLGKFLRRIGGIPIRRDIKDDFVSQIVREFQGRDRFALAIAPEGTRKRISRWKTGFYYIALKAGVPMQPAALDYRNKTMVFGPLIQPTGEIGKDVVQLREFFRPFEPRRPEKADKDFRVE